MATSVATPPPRQSLAHRPRASPLQRRVESQQRSHDRLGFPPQHGEQEAQHVAAGLQNLPELGGAVYSPTSSSERRGAPRNADEEERRDSEDGPEWGGVPGRQGPWSDLGVLLGSELGSLFDGSVNTESTDRILQNARGTAGGLIGSTGISEQEDAGGRGGRGGEIFAV